MSYDATRGDLNKQGMAARMLVDELAGDDAELAHDLVEGETDFFEAVERALSEIDECDIMAEGLAAHIKKLNDRLARVKKRAENVRGMIDQAFQMAEVQSHKFSTATISTKSIPPKLIVSDESEIPSRFFEPQPPKLDKKALGDAVKSGEAVPGAVMSNGGTTIQIRRA